MILPFFIVEPLIISCFIKLFNAEDTSSELPDYTLLLESNPSRIVKIRVWREPQRVILYCYLRSGCKELIKSTDWYSQNFSKISQVLSSESTKIFRQKLVLLSPTQEKSEKYFCKIKLLNGTQLLSEKISLTILDEETVERGNSVMYPRNGICRGVENFPIYIFLNDNQNLTELENGIKNLISGFERILPDNKSMINYFTHFLCYSQYTFYDKNKNITFRIHHDDLMNIMYLIRESLLFPDEILIPALKVYNENQDSIISKTGPYSARVIVSSILSSNQVDCLLDNGITYNGNVNKTRSGKPCIKWSEVSWILQVFSQNNNDHNFCRNPAGNEDLPFCFIDNMTFEYCVISPCSKIWFNKNAFSQPLLWLWILILVNIPILVVFLGLKYSDNLLNFFNRLIRRNSILYTTNLSSTPARSSSYPMTGTISRFISNISKTGEDSIRSRKEFELDITPESQILSLCASLALENDVAESLWDGVPFILLKSLNMSFVEPLTAEIYKAQLKSGDFKNLSCSTSDNYAKDTTYLIVRSEDTSDMVVRRYLFENSHLFTLYGIVLESTVNDYLPYGLIYEFFPLFDVSQYLQTKSLQNWPSKLVELVDILKQVTSAFCYIHRQKLVHADISLRNVFLVSPLTDDKLPKIKFGDCAKFRYSCETDYLIINLDKFINRTQIATNCLYLPIKWMAPELIQSIVKFEDENQIIVRVERNIVMGTISKTPGTFIGDIYSYGVLVWELFHDGKKPFDNIVVGDFIRQMVKEQTPRLIHQKIKGSVAKFISDCTDPQPESRPTVEEIEERSVKLSDSFNL